MVTCTMTILASPSDLPTLRAITHHLRKTANYEFTQTVLVIDEMPPHSAQEANALIQIAKLMLDEGEITKFVRLSEQIPGGNQFLEVPRSLRDHRGIPIMGWVAGIVATDSDYVCHFDSDILMHTQMEYSWVENAINCIEASPNVLYVAPFPGPPGAKTGDGRPSTNDWENCDTGLDGNWRQQKFVCRRFVIQRRRFDSLMPLPPQHISRKRKLAMHLGWKSSLLTWEEHMTHAIRNSQYWGVWLSDSRAWSLHCPDHGTIWRENIAKIIHAIEQGQYPVAQVGHYDLVLGSWLEMVESSVVLPKPFSRGDDD